MRAVFLTGSAFESLLSLRGLHVCTNQLISKVIITNYCKKLNKNITVLWGKRLKVLKTHSTHTHTHLPWQPSLFVHKAVDGDVYRSRTEARFCAEALKERSHYCTFWRAAVIHSHHLNNLHALKRLHAFALSDLLFGRFWKDLAYRFMIGEGFAFCVAWDDHVVVGQEEGRLIHRRHILWLKLN